MALKPVNNCTTQLISDLATAATVMSVVTTQKMPSLGASDYAYATLISIGAGFDSYGNPNLFEIVKIIGPLTPGAGQTVTIVRAQDGTVATQFTAGDIVDLRVNRATLLDAATAVNQLFVNVADFGAVGNGVTDDTAAVQAALNSLGSAGGTVFLPNNYQCGIFNNLFIPPNCNLVGQNTWPDLGSGVPIQTMGGALVVDAAATITINGGSSCLRGLVIRKRGLTFPQTSAASYAGIAIIANGNGAMIEECLIVGFATGFKSIGTVGWWRPKLYRVGIDCVNGVDLSNNPDVAYLNSVHCWPYGTTLSGGGAAGNLRSGIAFNFHDTMDAAKIEQCFAFGYLVGFRMNNVNEVELVNCRAETYTGPPPVGSIGFDIIGTSSGTSMVGCSTYSFENGIHINTSSGAWQTIRSGTFSASTLSGILMDAGNVSLDSNVFNQSASQAIGITNSTCRVVVDGCRFPANLICAFSTVGNTNVDFKQTNTIDFAGVATNNNISLPVVASSGIIAPPPVRAVLVSGTTTIGAIANQYPGRILTLIFQGALTVNNGVGAGGIRLSGGVNFAVTAGGTLTVVCDGARWYEIGRSA